MNPIFFLLFGALLCPGPVVRQDEAVKRFFDEAELGWEKIASSYSDFKFEIGITKKENGMDDGSVQYQVNQKGPNVRLELIGPEPESFWRIQNPDYSAVVTKDSRGFNIKELKEKESSEGFFEPTPLFQAYRLSRPGLCFDEACITDAIVGTRGFHNLPGKRAYIVTGGRNVRDENGLEVVELDLILALFDASKGKFMAAETGPYVKRQIKIRLLPQLNWTLLSYDLDYIYDDTQRRDQNRVSILFSYHANTAHPKSKIEESLMIFPRSGKIARSKLISCSELKPSGVPDSNYYLSSFGLTEPELKPKQKSWTRYAFWSLAIFSIVFVSVRLWQRFQN